MKKIVLPVLICLLLAAITPQQQVQTSQPNVTVKAPKNISPNVKYVPQNVEKPDLIVSAITPDTGGVAGLYVNAPLELAISVKNVFAYDGHSRKDFQIKVQFKYGYSGPVHKEKIIWVRKNLAPGEIFSERVVYGKVKSTPDELFVKVIVDATNVINERNENNNVDEIGIRIEKSN